MVASDEEKITSEMEDEAPVPTKKSNKPKKHKKKKKKKAVHEETSTIHDETSKTVPSDDSEEKPRKKKKKKSSKSSSKSKENVSSISEDEPESYPYEKSIPEVVVQPSSIDTEEQPDASPSPPSGMQERMNQAYSPAWRKMLPPCPYKWVWIPYVFVFQGLISFLVASYSCSTFESYSDGIHVASFGFWGSRDVLFEDKCQSYRDFFAEADQNIGEFEDYYSGFYADYYGSLADYYEDYYDELEADIVATPHIRLGRANGILGTIVAGPLFLFMTSLLFVAYPKRFRSPIFRTITGLCFFLAVCSILLLVGRGHKFFCKEYDSSCKGGASAILAFLYYSAAGGTIIYMEKRGFLNPRTPDVEEAVAESGADAQEPATYDGEDSLAC